MSDKFDRTVVVTIAKSRGFFDNENNAIIVRDLRVKFNVEKNLSEEPNTCTLVIYNLSEKTRGELQQKPLRVILEAGYAGETARVFVGDVKWIFSDKKGVDWETTIQLGDGERAYRHARVSKSYSGKVDVKTVIKDVAESYGLKMPKNVDDFIGTAKTFYNGMTTDGLSHKQMTKILKARGASWSVQDGRLQILKSGGTRPDEALVMSQETGMIGSPSLAAPKKPGEPSLLNVAHLLYPQITPGGKVSLKSRFLNGVYRVDRVQHEGDTHDAAWTTTVEGRAL